MRVLPLENESVNECWISDRDRFSYEGLNSVERLVRPMLEQEGKWHEVEWQAALDYAAHALGGVRAKHGAAALGALASPQSTLEELHLLGRVVRGLGSENVDCRPRVADASLSARMSGVPWLGMPIDAVNGLDRVLLVGSFLRKDHPLFASRVRAAAKRGARVAVLHGADDDLLMPIAAKAIVSPDRWAATLAGTIVALHRSRDEAVPSEFAGIEPDDAARALAAMLAQGKSKAVFLGNAVARHPQAAAIAALAQALAAASGATLGWLVDGANAVGGHLAGALPGPGGLDAAAMVAQPLKGYLLLGLEPRLDHGHPAAAAAAIGAADTVIALTAYRSAELLASADCLLPITPFTETAGTFVNCAGTAQTFSGVVRPRGDARPAWKVLRVLGNLLQLSGFDQDSVEQVRAQALPADIGARLSNAVTGPIAVPKAAVGLQRLADVPIYAVDPIVRRAPSLQETRDADAPQARMNAATLASVGVAAGDAVWVKLGGGEARLVAALDTRVADGTVRVAAAHDATARLAAMFGTITVEAAR
jgi:NADH-quinone oxidoreductase subunit G